jgi:hypothetical protein
VNNELKIIQEDITGDDLGKDRRKNSISFRWGLGPIQYEARGKKHKWSNLRYSLGLSPDGMIKSPPVTTDGLEAKSSPRGLQNTKAGLPIRETRTLLFCIPTNEI